LFSTGSRASHGATFIDAAQRQPAANTAKPMIVADQRDTVVSAISQRDELVESAPRGGACAGK
jgi:hypothetical protein